MKVGNAEGNLWKSRESDQMLLLMKISEIPFAIHCLLNIPLAGLKQTNAQTDVQRSASPLIRRHINLNSRNYVLLRFSKSISVALCITFGIISAVIMCVCAERCIIGWAAL